MSVHFQRASIQLDNAGLTRTAHFSDGSVSTFRAKWTEISRVVAFKRDCFAYDLLCIEIEVDGLAFEFDEEMEGWEGMINSFPEYMPGFPRRDEWWDGVVHPSFATNVTQHFPLDHEN
jgi:hypothetical protein